MAMNDSRKSVLVTGCTPGGIGHALAREFHSRGLRVLATARRSETISDLANLGVDTLSLEVTDLDSIKRLKSEVEALTGGRLDYLVNNAGRNYTVPALDVDIDEIRQTFEINVFAVMRICQAFAPLLMATKDSAIVQIGSIAAIMPYVFGSVYNASKAALHAYSDTLRVELAPFGVRVVTVFTGGVKSNIARVDRSLPQDSIYLPIQEEYDIRQKHSQAGALANDAYARSVVQQVLKARPPKSIWEGNRSWLVWFVHAFLPHGIMDTVFARMFNLWKLSSTSPAKKYN